MIFKQVDYKEASYLGDIEENKVGIDRANIDFIATLLTSNLYSKPLESFLRETVANAMDSHVEAGTQEKILMLIQDSEESSNSKIISIRDYGTGLSPERFNMIYKNIGSSTKRTSNAYIGMFGIGRLSCLAVSEVATVNSYYQGIKYSYLIYKNGTGINIDKISEEKGDFKNGLEVSVAINDIGCSELRRSINLLSLFDSLYIQYTGTGSYISQIVAEFNNRKVVRYNTFAVCDLIANSQQYACIGNVLYRMTEGPFVCDGNKVIPYLPMGEVDITPNREDLQYTDRTKKVLIQVKEKVADELVEKVKAKVAENLSLSTLYPVLCKSRIYLNDFFHVSLFYIPNIDLSQYSLEDIKLTKTFTECLKLFFKSGIAKDFIFHLYSPMRNILYKYYFEGIFKIYEKGERTFRDVTKKYYFERLYKAVILNYGAEEEIKKDLQKQFKLIDGITDQEIAQYTEYLISKLNITKLYNKDVPDSYIKDFKEMQKNKKISAKSCCRRYLGRSYSTVTLKSILERTKGRIFLYTCNTKEDAYLRELSDNLLIKTGDYPSHNLFTILTVSKKDMYLLENKKNFIHIKNFFTKKQKILCKWFTAKKVQENIEKYHYELASSYRDFWKKYKLYLNASVTGTILPKLAKEYEKKNWLIQEDLDKYLLSEEDIKILELKRTIRNNKNYYLDKLVYKTLGKNPKLGITLPKLNS